MTRLRVAFMGTPDFAVPSLAALIEAGHDIVAVYSQPPRPAGRGNKVHTSAVHAFAQARGIPVHTPQSLRGAEVRDAFRALELDAAVVAAYGLILPKAVLAAPRLGCFNVHGSLLPRWRGAAPIQRAILAGDPHTGITIMRMDAGLDTGPMLLQSAVPITAETTASTLHDTLAALGAELMVTALSGVAAGTLDAQPQPDDGMTYAAKIEREDGRLVWTLPAPVLDRKVRALTPWPGAWWPQSLPGKAQVQAAPELIKVLAAQPLPAPASAGAAPGTLLDDALTIACAEGTALRLLTVLRPGRGPVDGRAFLRGFALPIGQSLTAGPT